ncbi:MAG: tRNA (N6-threonylcarbamoyladenosine(37)-N6)-methyltransferase TrmO [Bacteroidales bacterium]|nr:tRNA (N6-threonylcarbamoyladenosine(37)-N6)-methyltransferase TrmO [Bacteroidales bacterium]
MEIRPIARFHAPLSEKFGLPRQAGLAGSLRGTILLEPEFRNPEALRGLEDFDYLWIIWEFHLNRKTSGENLTVRPPRLGGNERVGVFASRSPYRPNRLGLSSVRIESIDATAGEIHVFGADLADGTPIYDIKPYVAYADSHPGVRSGFVDGHAWEPLQVNLPRKFFPYFSPDSIDGLFEILSQDPRPQYQDDPERVYGLLYEGRNVKFRVRDNVLTVIEVEWLA